MNILRRIGFALLAPVIAVAIAMAATTLVIIATGSDSGVGDFWRIILTRPEDRILVNIVNQTSMLYLSATAAAVGFRMSLFNIGVEGQYRRRPSPPRRSPAPPACRASSTSSPAC